MPDNDILLEVNGLKTYFFLDEGVVHAVDGVSFSIRRGHTLGILGESGCGKSVTGFSILQLVQRPGRIVGGEILLYDLADGDAADAAEIVDIAKLNPDSRKIRRIRGAKIAMVFQEPMTSLDPVYTVGDQIMEAILYHQQVNKAQAREIAIEILRRVGMPQPEQTVDRYPHQLSGGMRQRVMIAIALSCRPSLLIADEPTTALDVTTEAQILELMRELQRDFGMAIIFITHNLGVIAEMAEEVLVMYLGKVVEQADVRTLFHQPKHPYTQALLQSVPKLGRKSVKRLDAIAGMVPSPAEMPAGCPFHPRCPSFMPGVCDVAEPPVIDLGESHFVRCFLYSE